MENDHADLTRRVQALEVGLEQTTRRANALLVALGWTLATLAPEDARLFLALQANEIEGNPRLIEHVAVLDELSEELARWREQWRGDQTPLRS